MSSPPSTLPIGSDAADVSLDDRLRALLARVRHQVLAPLRVVGFWSAIALPFLYVPLVATGLGSTAKVSVFLALLAANVVAATLGHSHSPGSR